MDLSDDAKPMDQRQQQHHHHQQQHQQHSQPQPQLSSDKLQHYSPSLSLPLNLGPAPGSTTSSSTRPSTPAQGGVASTSQQGTSANGVAIAAQPPQMTNAATTTTTSTTSNLSEFLARAEKGLKTLIGNGNIDARPSRQGVPPPKVGSCTACREAKAKCSGGAVCQRCLVMGLQNCEYPVFMKRGRKRAMTPNMILLESIHRDVETAMSFIVGLDRANRSAASTSGPTTAAHGSPSGAGNSHSLSPPSQRLVYAAANSSDREGHEDASERDPLASVIESPLAILAHISSMKISGTSEEETGTSSATLEKAKDETPADSYFSTGLYQARTDREPLLDPVNLGILSEVEFTRLVEYYFEHLHSFSWHLSREIHTPRFIRDVSPFLATALAYTVAAFEPTTRHLAGPLETHALYLSERVFSEGFKTLEIVQAYCLMTTWAPIEPNWGDDRRWSWIGQAMRIATEIRLDKALTPSMHQFYRSVSNRPEIPLQLLTEDRARSWTLLFVAEIALCVSTGRLGAVQGLNLNGGFRSTVPSVEPNSPHYHLCAMEELNRIYAKALALSAGLKDETSTDGTGLREAFNASWSHEMNEWEQRWPQANGYVRLTHQHNCTILLSISLRFRGGPTRQIFDECRASALKTVRLAAQSQGDSLEFASNFICVNVAYAATLILRIEGATKSISDQDLELRHLCRQAADLLERMGQRRPTTRTLHALHSTRLRTLLAASEPTIMNIPNPMLQNGQAPMAMPTVFHADPTQVAHSFLQFNHMMQHPHPAAAAAAATATMSTPPIPGMPTPTFAPGAAVGDGSLTPSMSWELFAMGTQANAPFALGVPGADWSQMNQGEPTTWGASEPGTWAW